jgi:alkylation response protein AidB-like acyl-CoA dehydrogenase
MAVVTESHSAPVSANAPYQTPADEIMVALDVAGLDGLLELKAYADVDHESVRMVLEEFGRLASEVIAPTNAIGDHEGATLDPQSGVVRSATVIQQAYARYVEGGWGALPFPMEFGGGGMPSVIGLATQEIFASANVALSLNPVLTQGAIEAIMHWGDDVQKATYLPRLITGEWTGTMNLTEPDAGSDLGEIRTMAEQDAEGLWTLHGTKIFITWGEHELAENIVHLVLARTPGAPTGTKGLSLFVVPKFLESPTGTHDIRNELKCVRLEEKLGIHASPTCVMEFQGARGELIGPLHGGIRVMFTMMNAARLSIGIQGPAIGERVLQGAQMYATNRMQGRAIGTVPPAKSPIIDHPDVRRMLGTISTTTKAARMLLFLVKSYEDRARHAVDDETRERYQQFTDLLTPVAKAWSTDVGFEAASLGVQVLGGVGYVEEFGMAQHLRDARIGPIYEGTNGIQALDLVTRKLPRDEGKWMLALCELLGSVIPEGEYSTTELAPTFRILTAALRSLDTATKWLLSHLEISSAEAIAGATPYLELLGITVGGYLMARRTESSWLTDDDQRRQAVAESNFFATNVMAHATGLLEAITWAPATLSAS